MTEKKKEPDGVPYSRLEREEDILPFLRRMYEYGYVEKPRANRIIMLTPYGKSVGKDHIYRHHSLSQHLQFIGVQEAVAEQDACSMTEPEDPWQTGDLNRRV